MILFTISSGMEMLAFVYIIRSFEIWDLRFVIWEKKVFSINILFFICVSSYQRLQDEAQNLFIIEIPDWNLFFLGKDIKCKNMGNIQML